MFSRDFGIVNFQQGALFHLCLELEALFSITFCTYCQIPWNMLFFLLTNSRIWCLWSIWKNFANTYLYNAWSFHLQVPAEKSELLFSFCIWCFQRRSRWHRYEIELTWRHVIAVIYQPATELPSPIPILFLYHLISLTTIQNEILRFCG